jgi:hypothetical protein
MTANKRLCLAYLLREQALDIFEEKDEATALQRLERWFANVKAAKLCTIRRGRQDHHGLSRRHPELLQVSAHQCGK